jgi:hypothetical protein
MSNPNPPAPQPKKLSDADVKKLIKDKGKVINSNQIVRK